MSLWWLRASRRSDCDAAGMSWWFFFSWDTGTECAAHCKVDTETKEAEQITRISVDHGFFGQPEDRAHNTLPVLVVLDRKSKALLDDLDFMVYNS